MVNLFLAVALSAASPALPSPVLPTPAAQSSDPAMFVVSDADTTVYIFGTFHALDGQSVWFKDSVRDAFESSNELVLETLIPQGPSPLAGRRLAPNPVAPSASFLASTRMAISAGKSQGMRVDNGADMVLRRQAEEEGKPVAGLETLESQLAMFSHMPPPPAQPTSSAQPSGTATATMNSMSQSMSEMQSAWKRGDQSVFVRVLAELEKSSPATYRMLFTERNARWADWVAARLQTPGTVFVAVGAGHLAGKDSVLVRLAQRGIQSRRVNPQVFAQR
jgi:uncharacterized protein YbaP (TraB family)